MATFNGWTIITMPGTPAPASIEFTAIDAVALSTSPFSGQQQVQSWGSAWLEVSVSLPPLRNAAAQAWIAFLLALQGTANVFQLADPLMTAPQGSPVGTPVVSGSPQTGTSLIMRGFTASAPNVLLPGDYIQAGYRLYRNLTAISADGAGHATANIWPPLRESPADGTALTFNNTSGLFRLKQNGRKWSMSAVKSYGLQFEAREAI